MFLAAVIASQHTQRLAAGTASTSRAVMDGERLQWIAGTCMISLPKRQSGSMAQVGHEKRPAAPGGARRPAEPWLGERGRDHDGWGCLGDTLEKNLAVQRGVGAGRGFRCYRRHPATLMREADADERKPTRCRGSEDAIGMLRSSLDFGAGSRTRLPAPSSARQTYLKSYRCAAPDLAL